MRSAHGAGFLYALSLDLGITNPDFVVGSSGDSANILSYAAQNKNQSEALKTVWTKLLSTSKFISLLRFWQIMNVDYLIDTVFKKEVSIGLDALQKSSMEYYIAVVDAVSGKPMYLSREDNIDPFEILRAANALPILYGKTVTLRYGDFIDGKIGQTVQDHIEFALFKGATRILLIDDSPERTFFRKIVIWLYAYTCTPALRKAVLRDLRTKTNPRVPVGVQLLYVQAKHLPLLIGKNKKKLQQTFEIGRQDALNREKELRTLFR